MDVNTGWHEAAIWDLENTTHSYQDIARKYGRSKDTLHRLAKKRNVVRPKGLQKGKKPAHRTESIDSAHRCIGNHVTIYKGLRPAIVVSEELGVSPYVLRMIEIGAHEITLMELVRIAKATGKSIPQLMSPYEAD